ncbi:MAG: type VI secretion system tube protein Hcp [Opitutus sp.]
MPADYFLKIDGIPGESPDAKHKDEIQLESWSWSESQAGSSATGGGGGTGKVQMQDFRFNMKVNKASPTLFLNCATGTHIKTANLTCRKAGGKQEEYLKIHFEDLLISSFKTGASAQGDAVPVEEISFNFAKIKYEYSPQKADGTLSSPIIFGYDVKLNQKI